MKTAGILAVEVNNLTGTARFPGKPAPCQGACANNTFNVDCCERMAHCLNRQSELHAMVAKPRLQRVLRMHSHPATPRLEVLALDERKNQPVRGQCGMLQSSWSL